MWITPWICTENDDLTNHSLWKSYHFRPPGTCIPSTSHAKPSMWCKDAIGSGCAQTALATWAVYQVQYEQGLTFWVTRLARATLPALPALPCPSRLFGNLVWYSTKEPTEPGKISTKNRQKTNSARLSGVHFRWSSVHPVPALLPSSLRAAEGKGGHVGNGGRGLRVGLLNMKWHRYPLSLGSTSALFLCKFSPTQGRSFLNFWSQQSNTLILCKHLGLKNEGTSLWIWVMKLAVRPCNKRRRWPVFFFW